MSRFLPPKGKGSYAIATCDRCGTKIHYDTLRPDGNSPGLMVCDDPGCWDVKDPWRLPARKTENIALRHPRPDIDVDLTAAQAAVTMADIQDDNL